MTAPPCREVPLNGHIRVASLGQQHINHPHLLPNQAPWARRELGRAWERFRAAPLSKPGHFFVVLFVWGWAGRGSGPAHQHKLWVEALYYDIHTGVREGSILSPLLYILFIDGLLDELSKSNLGVRLRNRLTGELTWVGALMYADDLLLLADGPGELQPAWNGSG